MAAMLPHIPADESLDRLRALPFVNAGPHGLVVHEAVRGPVAAALRSRDPARYQAYRHAASQVVRDQYRHAPRSDQWRCTADVLYLLENENLREGLFPTTESPVSVEPARAEDETSISAIIHKFDGPQSRQAMEQWWRSHPDSFFVVRDEHGGVQGFYLAIVASKVHKNVIGRDPLAASWAKDLPRLEDRPPLSGCGVHWIATREKGRHLVRRPAGSTSNVPVWNCVRGCAGSIPATVMRSYIAAPLSNWDFGWWTKAALSSTGFCNTHFVSTWESIL
jgi:hypothetical protein